MALGQGPTAMNCKLNYCTSVAWGGWIIVVRRVAVLQHQHMYVLQDCSNFLFGYTRVYKWPKAQNLNWADSSGGVSESRNLLQVETEKDTRWIFAQLQTIIEADWLLLVGFQKSC